MHKLIELGQNARKLAGRLDKLLYSETTLSKKEEQELFEKLGKKITANAMPNAAQFKTQLLSF